MAAGASPVASASTGYDISFPQCGHNLTYSAGFVIVGVNNGHPLSTNPCLASQLTYAQSTGATVPSFYMNTSSPGPAYTSGWPTSQQSPDVCSGANSVACSYDYGWNSAQSSLSNAVNAETSNGAPSPAATVQAAHWWLDVETGNQWETIETGYGASATTQAIDQAALQGALAYFASMNVSSVGIYSTPSQFKVIAGNAASSLSTVPVWVPGFATLSAAQAGCASPTFTGGRVAMIQYPMNGLDGDYICPLVSTPSTGSVAIGASASFTSQMAVSGVTSPVSYVQTGGTPDLTVSATGSVSTGIQLPAGTYTATGTTSDAAGDTGTFLFTLSVGVITQTSPISSTVKSPGSATFSNQVVVSGNSGPTTFVEATGAPNLLVSPSGLITTNGNLPAGNYLVSGTVSDAVGDAGTFVFTLGVGVIAQAAPTASSVVTSSSATFTDQLAVSHNDGAVTYAQTSGSPNLVVSPSGLVTTGGALALGSYSAKGTTSDAFGDKGTFVFTLKVAAQVVVAVPTAPVIANVVGHASAGKTVTLAIVGRGFYGRPLVTSHPGTTALVTRDSGTMLVVRVAVKPRSRNGVFTFTVTLANGLSGHVKYNQH